VTEYIVQPVGVVQGGRREWVEDHWGSVVSAIDLSPDLPPDTTLGLADFSHLEVIYLFDRVTDDQARRTHARHPRGNTQWPLVGLFASRGMFRPNRLGLSRCRLLEVHARRLIVQGLDALDGSPVLDIKPHFAQFSARDPVHQPPWVDELTQHYF
jgi:tRNA-Thr(GGU) m(6)t(6)A37 methyltransferase TsaA